MPKIPLPTPRQEEWADLEMGVIINHCMETYHPDLPPSQWKRSPDKMPASSFAPTDEGNGFKPCFSAHCIGHKRIIELGRNVTAARLKITRAVDEPIIKEFTCYK